VEKEYDPHRHRRPGKESEMSLTRESIRTILQQHGYRAVFDDTETAESDVRSASRYAEARSPRIEVLQRQYGVEADRDSRGVAAARGAVFSGTGAIVMVEPLDGHGRRKAVVLSEEGEILGEQG
jgi:hypothetical protein